MSRKTTAVSGGQTGTKEQYNYLRDEAEASSRLLARQQASPNMTLYVSEGAVYFGSTRIDYAGGNSPSFVAPVSNPRIDCLSMNSSGALVITQGVEGASPAEPTCPSGNLPICLIYNRVGETVIKNASDGSNGYIYKDTRKFIQQTGGTSFVDTQVYSGNPPSSYTDLDLSSVVGSAQRMVLLSVKNNSTGLTGTAIVKTDTGGIVEWIGADGGGIGFRTNGDTATIQLALSSGTSGADLLSGSGALTTTHVVKVLAFWS